MARARIAEAANFLLIEFNQRDLVMAIETAATGQPALGRGQSVRSLLKRLAANDRIQLAVWAVQVGIAQALRAYSS